MLRRYWFSFVSTTHTRMPPGTRIGCGVTAFDQDDALGLLCSKVFKEDQVPPIMAIREDVDVSALDDGHIRPNMGDPSRRGVWFPLGYDQ
jgi:hypothetical protein